MNNPTKFTEIKEIIISVLILSIAFAWIINPLSTENYSTLFILSLFSIGLGFMLHELAHKFIAQKFNCKTHYELWKEGLAATLILAYLFKIMFAAPGTVWIEKKHLTTKENGLIAIAGPLTNISLACAFLLLWFQNPIEIIKLIASFGFNINMLLAGFNMIPFGPLDGKKVLVWNPLIWAITTLIPIFFLVILPNTFK